MLAALMRGEPFVAELAVVYTALFSLRRLPWDPLCVRRYARLPKGSNCVELPPIKATLNGSFAGLALGSDYSVGGRSVSARGVRI